MWWAKGRAAKDEEGPCAALQASRVWCGGERAAERPSAPLAQSCLGTSGGEVRGVSEARVRGVCLGACVWGRVFGGACLGVSAQTLRTAQRPSGWGKTAIECHGIVAGSSGWIACMLHHSPDPL